MGDIIRLDDRVAICPQCGKINPKVAVLKVFESAEPVYAGPCAACRAREGRDWAPEESNNVIALPLANSEPQPSDGS